MMLSWLVVFGVGGCWSGYTDATIIEAPDYKTAMGMAGQIAIAETADERGFRHGCSFDVEQITGDVRETANYASRCKPQARRLAELAAEGVQIYESLKSVTYKVAHG